MTFTLPGGLGGFTLSNLSLTITDSRSYSHGSITISTEDEGGGVYLRLEIDAGPTGLGVTVEELEAIAALGRQLVTLVDGK